MNQNPKLLLLLVAMLVFSTVLAGEVDASLTVNGTLIYQNNTPFYGVGVNYYPSWNSSDDDNLLNLSTLGAKVVEIPMNAGDFYTQNYSRLNAFLNRSQTYGISTIVLVQYDQMNAATAAKIEGTYGRYMRLYNQSNSTSRPCSFSNTLCINELKLLYGNLSQNLTGNDAVFGIEQGNELGYFSGVDYSQWSNDSWHSWLNNTALSGIDATDDIGYWKSRWGANEYAGSDLQYNSINSNWTGWSGNQNISKTFNLTGTITPTTDVVFTFSIGTTNTSYPYAVYLKNGTTTVCSLNTTANDGTYTSIRFKNCDLTNFSNQLINLSFKISGASYRAKYNDSITQYGSYNPNKFTGEWAAYVTISNISINDLPMPPNASYNFSENITLPNQLWIDFGRFRDYEISNFYGSIHDYTKSVSPNILMMGYKIGGSRYYTAKFPDGEYSGQNQFEINKTTDIFNTEYYPEQDSLGNAFGAMYGYNKPIIVNELGGDLVTTYPAPATYWNRTLPYALHAINRGAQVVIIYNWNGNTGYIRGNATGEGWITTLANYYKNVKETNKLFDNVYVLNERDIFLANIADTNSRGDDSLRNWQIILKNLQVQFAVTYPDNYQRGTVLITPFSNYGNNWNMSKYQDYNGWIIDGERNAKAGSSKYTYSRMGFSGATGVAYSEETCNISGLGFGTYPLYPRETGITITGVGTVVGNYTGASTTACAVEGNKTLYLGGLHLSIKYPSILSNTSFINTVGYYLTNSAKANISLLVNASNATQNWANLELAVFNRTDSNILITAIDTASVNDTYTVQYNNATLGNFLDAYSIYSHKILKRNSLSNVFNLSVTSGDIEAVLLTNLSTFNLTTTSVSLIAADGTTIDSGNWAQITSSTQTSIKFNSSQNYTGTNWLVVVAGDYTGIGQLYWKGHNDAASTPIPAANISFNGTHTTFHLENINVGASANSNVISTCPSGLTGTVTLTKDTNYTISYSTGKIAWLTNVSSITTNWYAAYTKVGENSATNRVILSAVSTIILVITIGMLLSKIGR